MGTWYVVIAKKNIKNDQVSFNISISVICKNKLFAHNASQNSVHYRQWGDINEKNATHQPAKQPPPPPLLKQKIMKLRQTKLLHRFLTCYQKMILMLLNFWWFQILLHLWNAFNRLILAVFNVANHKMLNSPVCTA